MRKEEEIMKIDASNQEAVARVVERIKRQAGQVVCSRTAAADIVFLVDSSGSIEYNQRGDYQREKEFVVSVIRGLDVGADRVRVGMSIFGDRDETIFTMNQYFDIESMVRAVQGARYMDAQTNIYGTFQNLFNTHFNPSAGDRQDAPNMVIMITDGRQEPEQLGRPEVAAEQFRRQAPASVICVGVGPAVDTNELMLMSGIYQVATQSWEQRRDHSWFQSPDFASIGNLVAEIQNVVCTTIPGPGPGPIPGPGPEPAPPPENIYCRRTCDGVFCWCLTASPIFPTNGTQCIDIDECSVNNGGCEDQCNNEQGSYRCSCPQGFQLGQDNHACEDVDECVTQSPCFGQQCVNTWGGYTCMSQPFQFGAAALTGGGVEAASVTSSSSSITTVVLAVVVSVLNLLFLVVMTTVCVRRVRRKRAQKAAAVQSNGQQTAFPGAGTIRSFNSLSSKYPADDFDDECSSTIS